MEEASHDCKIAIPSEGEILCGVRMTPGFNLEAFYTALNTERLARRKNWKQVAEESNVPASTLSRMRQGKRPDVDSFAKLLSWSNLKAENFIEQERPRPRTTSLSEITALLRADPKLTAESKRTLEHVINSTYSALLAKG